jgi:predicted nicotinamide N-methyase
MTPEATLARFRDYLVGPTRFMNLLACFELGLIDRLRERPGLTAAELGEAAGAKADAVEQLLLLPIKEGLVAYDEQAGTYSLDALAGVAEQDLRRVLTFMDMVKVVMLRQSYYLTDSVRTGTLVGLKELYGYDGILFTAVAEHQELRDSWMRLAESETAAVYHWFFDRIDVPAGARVLDLLGGTGLGAVMTTRLKASPGLRVTTFDAPVHEAECLRTFEAAGVAEQCSFVGGDVLAGIPRGFDVVLFKHFIDMFDKDEVRKVLAGVHDALEVGGQVYILAPVYPEDLRDPDDYHVDFFPTFLLGCAIGHGGLQKLSTYAGWLEEAGLKVTRVITRDRAEQPPDTMITRVILCATKTA